MKKILYYLCAVGFLMNTECKSEEIKASSKLSEVTVYRTAGKELRTSKVNIPKGHSEVVLSDVPMSMIDNSLQVSVMGSATLLSASVRMNYFTEINENLINPLVQQYQDSIKKIDLELRWSEEQKNLINGEIELIKELLKENGGKENVKVSDMNAMIDLYKNRIGGLKKKLFDLVLKAEINQEKKVKYNGQLNEISNQKTDPVKEIILSFSSDLGADLQLRTAYVVSQVSWKPLYDIMVENTNSPVDLTYKAKIVQTTGYDWKDIKLKVSTTNPMHNNNRPVLNPKYIDYITYRVQPRTSEMGNHSGLNMMHVEKVVFSHSQHVDFLNYEPDILEEYEIAGRHIIPGNGKEYVFKIQNFKIPATYKYHAVPRLDKSAFLLAKITKYGQYNLLKGNANVFYGENYIGQITLDTELSNDTMLISLGRDERIVINKTRVSSKISKNFLGTTQIDTYAYEIQIRNNKNVPIEIEVLDQIPLTKRKEIEVELIDKSSADYNETYGKMIWYLNVNANENKKVQLSYRVKYPTGKQVAEQ